MPRRRTMSSDTFWVHAAVVTDPWAGWYGPYTTQERAEQEAAGRTAPWTGEAEFAEVVRGTPGGPGRSSRPPAPRRNADGARAIKTPRRAARRGDGFGCFAPAYFRGPVSRTLTSPF